MTDVAQLTSTLVQTRSVTGDESAVVSLVAQLLRDAGADEVDEWTTAMADLAQDDAFPGTEVARDETRCVAAVARGRLGAGPRVMLQGHLDVVPPGDPDAWTRDPWDGAVADGFVHGRGACDMKGGVAAALATFLDACAGERAFRGELLFVGVSGEEDGGVGALAAIRRGWVADACVISEPTAAGGLEAPPDLVIAHGGSTTLELVVAGKGAHAAMRLEGESALDHFTDTVYPALRAAERAVNAQETRPEMLVLGLPYPTSVGVVEGGSWPSTVMDRLAAQVRVGVPVWETVAEAEARTRAALEEAAAASDSEWLRAHPPTLARVGAAFEASAVPRDAPLVAAVEAAAAEVWGAAPTVRGAPYGCDMRLYVHLAGMPVVVYGPGDPVLAHAANERVSVAQVEGVRRVLGKVVGGLLAPVGGAGGD